MSGPPTASAATIPTSKPKAKAKAKTKAKVSGAAASSERSAALRGDPREHAVEAFERTRAHAVGCGDAGYYVGLIRIHSALREEMERRAEMVAGTHPNPPWRLPYRVNWPAARLAARETDSNVLYQSIDTTTTTTAITNKANAPSHGTATTAGADGTGTGTRVAVAAAMTSR
jgi:hypothetical protein